VGFPKRAVPGALSWAKFTYARALALGASKGARGAVSADDRSRAKHLAEEARDDLATNLRDFPALAPKLDAVKEWLARL
jgi:hypothetical protein